MLHFAHASGPAGDEAELEHEIKFLLPPSRVASALACLRSLCRPDPVYPANEVHSLYYDTPGLELLYGKLNGDLYKTKVRLRWYRDGAAGNGGWGEGGSYIEVKQRFGTRRKKLRAAAPWRADRIVATSLNAPELLQVPASLGSHGRAMVGWLQPCLVVSYERRRFDDPSSGTRISVDTRLAVERVNPTRLALRPASPSPVAVLEIKNRRGELPARLVPLLALGARRSAFSKYGACFSAALFGASSGA